MHLLCSYHFIYFPSLASVALYVLALLMSIEAFIGLLQKEVGLLLTPPTGKERADGWKGLEIERLLQIKFEDVERYN